MLPPAPRAMLGAPNKKGRFNIDLTATGFLTFRTPAILFIAEAWNF